MPEVREPGKSLGGFGYFTGLNNLNVFSITDSEYGSYFGFTDGEVKGILKYYGLSDKYDMIKEWYNGYHFGEADVYCPWDVINYVHKLVIPNMENHNIFMMQIRGWK